MSGLDRPFVDAPVGDVSAAERLAVATAEHLGLGDVELVRVGMNAVFATQAAVLRVGRPTADPVEAARLAERLTAIGLRVPRPVIGDADLTGSGAAAPSELAVSVWERIESSGESIDWERVGAMVARLHRLADDDLVGRYPCPSPRSFPWWDLATLLEAARPDLDERAASGLADTISRHAWWRDAAARNTVVCHGDVHPGNVVQTATGPVLLDWDLLCRAPAGWDHAPMMTWAERWGGEEGEYEAYASGYGRSMRDDPFAAATAELRLVAATLMRVRAGRDDPAARVEAERRLSFWRGDVDAPVWRAQ